MKKLLITAILGCVVIVGALYKTATSQVIPTAYDPSAVHFGDTLIGDVTATFEIDGSTATIIASNSIDLGADTTGNYVTSISNGTGITGGDGGSEGAALTLATTLGTAIDSTEITDNTILEVDFKAVDSATDEDFLTYESTTGDFEWHSVADISALIAADIAEGELANSIVVSADIKDDTIDSADYNAGSIDAEHLAADIIDETKIADNGIDSEHYNDGSIDAAHLAADVIDETKIADNGIDSEHYNDGSIDLVHLASGVYAKDIVTTAPITGATDNVLVGADADITLAITVLKDLVTTAPVTGGTNDILTGSDADITIALDFTAAWDFGGASSFEITNAAAPTTNATGEFALDTTITDHQPLWQYYDGGENMTLIAIDTAQLPAEDNEIVKYDAGSDKFVLEADASAGTTAYDDISDPDASGSISFDAAEAAVYTSSDDEWVGITISNTQADNAGDTELLTLAFTDDGDTNSHYLIMSDAAGTQQLEVIQSTADIQITTAGDLKLVAGGGDFNFADDNIATTGNILADGNLSVGNTTTTAGVLTLLEDDDDGANFASFMVPALAANTVYTLPPDDGDNTEVLQTDGSGTLTWVAAGGSTAWDDIADPDNDGLTTIDFDHASENTILTTAYDASGSFFTIQNSDADVANALYLLDLDFSVDDNQANADYFKCQDAGGVVFSIQEGGRTTIAGDLDVGGDIDDVTNIYAINAIYVDNIDVLTQAIMPLASADPDVDAAGEISNDTDGANETGDVSLRGHDGSNQFLYSRKIKLLCAANVIKPNDLADATRDKCQIGFNNSGMTATVTQIVAWSDTDDTAFTLLEFDEDGAGNQATIDAVNCTTGSGPYTADETTITGATIEASHTYWVDFDDTDTPGQVFISVWGWYNSDVN